MKKLILMLGVAISITSCATQERQQFRAEKYFNQHPKELAELCSDKYPVKEETVAGEPVVTVDTVTKTDTVTVEAECPDGTKAMVKCPPNTINTIHEKVTVTDTVYKENTAKYAAVRIELDEANDELKDSKEIAKNRLHWNIGLGIVVVLVFGSWIFKMFKLK